MSDAYIPEGMAKPSQRFSLADSASDGAGWGCTFRFRIKAEAVATQATTAGPRAKTAIEPQRAQHRPLRIVPSGDNVVNRQLAPRLPGPRGDTADVAGKGAPAAEAGGRQPDDRMQVNLPMPGPDGIEAHRRISARHAPGEHPRLVAMTGNAIQGDREACPAAGMDDDATEPIRAQALTDAPRRVHTR